MKGKLNAALDAASSVALSQQKGVIASEKLLSRALAYLNGSPNHPERAADLGGVERGGLLAGPARRGVRLHGRRDAGNLEADHTRHHHRRSGQRANANQAEATDPASVITLANELRAALVEKDMIKGEA